MDEPTLDEKVIRLHEALDRAGIAHAFGGALALAYYAEPRATIDIDLNVFLPPGRAGGVLEALAPLGVAPGARAQERAGRDGQVRVAWGRTPLDLFFASAEIHTACEARVRRVPFGPIAIPILAAEHLMVFKALFDRRKDWLDIEQMLAGSTDVAEARRWLGALVGDDDDRRRRFEEAVRAVREG